MNAAVLSFPRHRVVGGRHRPNVEAQIAKHYDVLSRDLTSVKAILAKALTVLDQPTADPKGREVAYWRNRLKHAVSLVEMADNEADCLREVALDPGPQERTAPGVSEATVESLLTFYREACEGDVIGVACIAFQHGHRYKVHTSGVAEINPTFTRGAIRALDDMVREKVNRHE